MASKGIEKDRRSIYLACEEMDFTWKRKDVDDFEFMWSEGKSIRQIGDVLNRDPDEVLILALDRIKNRKIKTRPGGALGGDGMITFVINEPPMGAVRMTQRGKWTSESAQRYLAYKSRIGFSARKQFSEPLEGPVAVEIGFRYPFPKSWTKKRLREALESQELPTIKPDIDNCVKGIFDALNKIAWKDDSQVVALITRKYYSDHPEIEVKVWQIGEEAQGII